MVVLQERREDHGIALPLKAFLTHPPPQREQQLLIWFKWAFIGTSVSAKIMPKAKLHIIEWWDFKIHPSCLSSVGEKRCSWRSFQGLNVSAVVAAVYRLLCRLAAVQTWSPDANWTLAREYFFRPSQGSGTQISFSQHQVWWETEAKDTFFYIFHSL